MREILFRGKRCDNGEWVQGYYIRADHHWHKHGIHKDWITLGASANGGWFALHKKYAVKAETVGQFTGRVDKNGTRVFEGDIISITAFAPNIFVGVVLWDDHDQCYLIVKDPIEQIHIDDFGNYGKPSYYEVIGNIHDNPELLENP